VIPPSGRELRGRTGRGVVFHGAPGKRDGTALTIKRLARTGALPSLPEVAARGAALARDPESGPDELRSVIEADLGLAARVLRLAHFDHVTQLRGTDALSRSIDRIGLRKIRDLLLAVGRSDFYGPANPAGRRLWEHSVATAVISGELSSSAGWNPREISVAALPGKVGRMVFLLVDADWVEEMDGRVEVHPDERCELERAHFGIDEEGARAELLSHWGLEADAYGSLGALADALHGAAEANFGEIISRAAALASALGYPLDSGRWEYDRQAQSLLDFDGGEQGLRARVETRMHAACGRLS
jgi:HD-like signal output (HDOD) protein